MLKLKSVNFEQQQFEEHFLDQRFPGQLDWSIGRNAECDLVLLSPEVSRVHGRISYTEAGYCFTDLGSTTGSLLNGEVVPVNENRLIEAGDLLQLGETFLRIEEMGSLALPEPVAPPWIQWGDELSCRCCRIVDETPDVKTFCFVADKPMLFHYQPGQFVTVQVEIDGKPVMRSYTISSSPSRPWHLSLTVKRVPAPAAAPGSPPLPAGLVSNWLHDNLKVGDQVKFIGGAMGDFTCLPLPPKLLLISAGSGITPMLSMSRWIHDTMGACDVIFLHSARTPDDIICRTELETLAAQLPNFRLAITLTQQPLMQSWLGLTGRISQSLLNLVAPDLMERAVYVCGSEGFMQGIKATLDQMNFPMQQYKEESFGGAKKPSAKAKAAKPAAAPAVSAAAGTTADSASSNGKVNHLKVLPSPESAPASAASVVSFAKSKCDVPLDETMSVLELAEQEGVQIRSACRAGACGACKVLASQGKVRYEGTPKALSQADQKAGYLLACVAYPVERLVIEA
jgi:glycine betaine catabolism B